MSRREHARRVAVLGSPSGPLGGSLMNEWNTAQHVPSLVLLSSVRGIQCGLGGSSVRIPLTRTGPHTRTHSMPIKHIVPPLIHIHTHSMSNSTCTPHAHRTCAHRAHATRSRAPNDPRKARHEAGYRSRICLNRRRNTNLARETRTLCPVGRTSLSPWV